MNELRDVPAPAKLNLFLHVVGRRTDGYHLLQTAFRFIDLADTLHFTRRTDGRIRRVTDLPGVAPADCLTVRAAHALQRASGCSHGVDIELEKRIPAGGGLGGGSSDAASVLLALNRLWGTGLTRAQLMELALPLGADVPVFVFSQNAFAEGVGEALQPLELAPRWYVVVQPDAHVSTADVFSAPELTRNTTPVKITDFVKHEYERSRVHTSSYAEGSDFFAAIGKAGGAVSFHNDLEPVVLGRFVIVAQARQFVAQTMARAGLESPHEIRMSGSGACFFIECMAKPQADIIHAAIAATIGTSGAAAKSIGSVHVCAGLDRHPLQHWAV